MISIVVNNVKMNVEDNISIKKAVEQAGVKIPTLCYHKDLLERGVCGLCIVEIEGTKGFVRSCITNVKENMVITTHSPELRNVRKNILELVLSSHDDNCLSCISHGKCELQDLAEEFGVRDKKFDDIHNHFSIDSSSTSITRDMNKCIGCGRCVDVCTRVQSVTAISLQGRGSETHVSSGQNRGMGESICTNCGQCVVFCPVGALYEKESISDVWKSIEDKTKTVVAQIAPSVRVALGEEFGLDPGTLTIGKIYRALKILGIDTVFDTNFSADLTIMEEGTELLTRVKDGGPFPLITSCSPGWVKFAETYFPDFLTNISSCKSPQQMLGALSKTYYAEKNSIDAKDIVTVSIMPCTAKKFECSRTEINGSGYKDVDFVLTTRELARMIKEAGIDFVNLEDATPDPFMSEYSGAATIFGTTGGVMEAALRTAYELQTGETLETLEFHGVRGFEGIKTAKVMLHDLEVRVAVAHGLANARELFNSIREHNKTSSEPLYHFVEIMACTGGCVGGGGQPKCSDLQKRMHRAAGLYLEDGKLSLRKSHENSEVKALYENFLGEAGGHKAHELLHTTYVERNPFS